MESVHHRMDKDLMEMVTDHMGKAKDRTEIIIARMAVVTDPMLTNTAVVTVRNLTDTKLKDLMDLVMDRMGEAKDRTEIIISRKGHVAKSSAAMKLQRCFAIRDGINGLLDVARKTFWYLTNVLALWYLFDPTLVSAQDEISCIVSE